MLTENPDQLRERLAADLIRARERTKLLTAVDDTELLHQHSPLMSPLVWDLAHIGNQEELWLLRDVAGRDPLLPETVDQLYDAFQHPRSTRPSLPLLEAVPSRRYVDEVRGKVLDVLERIPLHGRPLLENGFAFGMIVQHEQQHDETMLATHQLRAGEALLTAPPAPAAETLLPQEVLIPGGRFVMGTDIEPWALDNERPAHAVEVPSFFIDATPVTNADYLPSSRPAATRIPGGGTRTAGSTCAAPGCSPPSSGPVRESPGTEGSSGVPSRCGRNRLWCTCAGTRPTPTPAGPADGCPPRRSGRRPLASTRSPGVPGDTPGETTIPRRTTPISASGTWNRPMSVPIRPEGRPWVFIS